MDIYVMGIVYCPMNKTEQDSDSCLGCSHYDGHQINNGKNGAPRLYAACNFTGSMVNALESTGSKVLAVVVNGEPLPPTPLEDESWKRIKKAH